ncbi:hypothetical protein SLS55_006904 [Diplodia seriata]|uniref:Uncharacterized protein n=1 Tax=Diplodia seriata TaxID=420778 RepID=A0ABR3CAS1_9PEZI
MANTLQLALLAAAALVRTLVATCYAFADFNRAAALALAWDGDVDGASFPSFFTPETYAANQGWGDGTSPGVAAQAKAARGCCAALTGLAGVGVVVGLRAWRAERGKGRERLRGEEEEGGEGGGGGGEEVEGREVVELMGDQRGGPGELGGSNVALYEAEGKQMHEMEGSGAGAHEVQGRQIHEMEGGGGGGGGERRHQQQRRVYEMDATESAVWREGVRDADADVDEGKWERVP